ncbi:MAG: hypothetical protein AAFQ63_08980 [Cyanobacteria bacterium J06621_11]
MNEVNQEPAKRIYENIREVLDPDDEAQHTLYLAICAVLSQYTIGNVDGAWSVIQPLEDRLSRLILERDLKAS